MIIMNDNTKLGTFFNKSRSLNAPYSFDGSRLFDTYITRETADISVLRAVACLASPLGALDGQQTLSA